MSKDMPYDYRDAWTSVVRTYHVVDETSSKAARFADWADDALDRNNNHIRDEVWAGANGRDDRSARGGRSLFDQIEAEMRAREGEMRTSNTSKVASKPLVSSDEEAMAEWKLMNKHPLWGFMVRAERACSPRGYIPEGRFMDSVREECVELKRMIRTQKASEQAVVQLAITMNTRRT